jgi:uncharacterized membrane protein
VTAGTVRPTRITRRAAGAALAAIAGTAALLLVSYGALPDVLPVHFRRDGVANGWQYKTYWRVLMPVLVQIALVTTLGSIGALLLSRPHGEHEHDAPDVRTAAAATEAVVLIGLIWIIFQGYAAYALTQMWRSGRGGLGVLYTLFELTGVVLSVIVFVRAQIRFGRPSPRPFVPEHWRFGQLYKNPLDPALFVPTRDGSRWTLNFGRPVAAALMGVILGLGIVGPAVILGLSLR